VFQVPRERTGGTGAISFKEGEEAHAGSLGEGQVKRRGLTQKVVTPAILESEWQNWATPRRLPHLAMPRHTHAHAHGPAVAAAACGMPLSFS
jgi:hypothetical protein